MNAFKSALSRGLNRVYDTAGEPATYTDRNGVITPCTVLVEQDLTRYGESAQVNVKTAVLSVRVSEVPEAPRRGETFAISGGAFYKVDSLQGSDGFEHKVFAA